MAEKKEQAYDFKAFKKDISAGNIKKLYVFQGEEDYLREFYLSELKKLLIPPGFEAFNLHTLEGKGLDVERLSSMVDAFPMMADRSMIIVRDFDLFKGTEAVRKSMETLFSDLPEYCCLVFVYDTIEYKPDKRMKKLYSLLSEDGRIVEFSRQSGKELLSWVRRRFASLDRDIDEDAAEHLLFLCGTLMTGLISEIEKIAAYSKSKRVTREDVIAVASPVLDAVVFNLTDAIATRNFEAAIMILRELILMREEPIGIIAALGKQLRRIYSARIALNMGKGAPYLMEAWDIRFSFQATKLINAARLFSERWCALAVRLCAEADIALKSVSEDTAAKERRIELLVLRLAQES